MENLLNLGSEAVKQLIEQLDLVYMITLLLITWYINVLFKASNHVAKLRINMRTRWIVLIVGIVWGIVCHFCRDIPFFNIFISWVTMLVLNEYFGFDKLFNKWLNIKTE